MLPPRQYHPQGSQPLPNLHHHRLILPVSTSYKWKQTECALLWLASQHYIWETRPCSCRKQSFSPFSLLCSIPLHEYPVDGHLACFWFVAIRIKQLWALLYVFLVGISLYFYYHFLCQWRSIVASLTSQLLLFPTSVHLLRRCQSDLNEIVT